MYLPLNTPSSTEISAITGIVEQYNASGTLTGYEQTYYLVPFFVWIVLAVPTIWIGSRIIKEFVKRW